MVDQSSIDWKQLLNATKCNTCNDLSSDGNHKIYKEGDFSKMCLTGHFSCVDCFQNANNTCSVCKSANVCNAPFLKNIFDILPKACTNQGCSFTGWVKDHFKVCEFRLVSCKIVGCSWSGAVQVLLDHLQKCHTNISIVEDGFCVISSLHQLNQMKECQFVTPFKVDGCLFWKYDKLDYKAKRFYSFVQCVPTLSCQMNCIWSIKMKKDKIEFSYFRQVYDLDVDQNQIFEEVQCFSVPLDMLPYFSDEENDVKYTCKIIIP